MSYLFLKCDVIECNSDSSPSRTKFKGSCTVCIRVVEIQGIAYQRQLKAFFFLIRVYLKKMDIQ